MSVPVAVDSEAVPVAQPLALQLVREGHVARIGAVHAVDARQLFAPLGATYDRVGAVLSFGQDPRWRRFLVSRLPPGGTGVRTASYRPGGRQSMKSMLLANSACSFLATLAETKMPRWPILSWMQ